MNNLMVAIYSKLAGSTLTGLISGRMYQGKADPGAAMPYVVFSPVGEYRDKTFHEEYVNTRVQFAIYTAGDDAPSVGQAIYEAIIDLYDECALTIIGSTLLWMRIDNTNYFYSSGDNPEGTGVVPQIVAEFDVRESLN